MRFLEPHFEQCKEYLYREIEQFKPTLVMTLGEPAHKLFRRLINEPEKIKEEMNKAFTGTFESVTVGSSKFHYSPCLHIKTFRVAETYGDGVAKFKEGLIRICE